MVGQICGLFDDPVFGLFDSAIFDCLGEGTNRPTNIITSTSERSC